MSKSANAMKTADTDRRQGENSRFKVKGGLPGRLMCGQKLNEITARPVDVSRRGLGLIINKDLRMGSSVWLVLPDLKKEFRLEVIYCQQHMGIDNMFRVGLFMRDPDANLEQLFREMGVLDLSGIYNPYSV